MNEKKIFVKWVKEHKTELFIAGVTVMSVTCAVLLCKEQKQTYKGVNFFVEPPAIDLNPFLNVSDNLEVASSVRNKIVAVRGFVRNLPSGQHPSQIKLEEAAARGVELLHNQTLVAPHQRSCAA